MFHSIPLWIHSSSLEAITHLSQSKSLRGYVRHIVFSTIQILQQREALESRTHLNAYHAALQQQKYLSEQESKVELLARALRKFKNLKNVTIEDRNGQIGFRQLIRDFGSFKAADLLTCNGTDTVLPLIYGLSEAGIQLSNLTIGSPIEPSSWENTPNIFSIDGSKSSYPSPLCWNVMFTAFCDPENITHVEKVLSQLQKLEITDLEIPDDPSDIQKMTETLQKIVKIAKKLVHVNVGPIESHEDFTELSQFSVADIFDSLMSHDCLSIVTLSHCWIWDYHKEISFIKLYAQSLQKINFISLFIFDAK